MEKEFVIYDTDSNYAMRFMEFFQKRKDFDFEISAFTRKDSFEEFMKQHKIEILLLGDGISYEEIPKDNIRYIYQLSDHPVRDGDTGFPGVFKFRSVQDLMNEVIKDYKEKENETADNHSAGKVGIITVFTPIPDAAKVTFAWSLAIQLSEMKKVLFLSLDSLPVPILSHEDNSNQNLSEFIYYLKENNPDIIIKMKSLLHFSGNLSYLSGLTHGLDLFSVNKEDVYKWIEEIKSRADYDTVIFYLSHYSDSTVEIINSSKTVFITMTDKPYEKAVIKEWERQMEFVGIDLRQDRFHKILFQKDDWMGKPISIQELQNSAAWESAERIVKDL